MLPTSRRHARAIAAVAVVFALALAACGRSPTPRASPAPNPATGTPSGPTITPTAATTAAPASPAPATAAGAWNPPNLALQVVARGLEAPIFVGNAGDGSGRLFIIEQAGRIRVARDGALLPAPFLDISDRIASGGERGLLGLAFSRTFARDGIFYVDYTDRDGNTVVCEFRANPGSDVADPTSLRFLLQVEQPYANHNGGALAVARDGTLFIATGDGGSGGDPQGNGQRRDTLLGKLLRIDPRASGGAAYTVPAGNPFFGSPDILPEIWAYGLRNPWRFSFDRATGDLWIGDVGQGRWEEVDRVRAEAGGLPRGGLNFGWNTMEASHCFEPAIGCARDGLTLPVDEYDHEGRCSITGGYVVRGAGVAGLAGTYVYGDYCAGTIWGLDAAADRPAPRVLAEAGISIASFGEDETGDVYLADIAGGTVSRLVAAP